MKYKLFSLRSLKNPTRENAEIDVHYLKNLVKKCDLMVAISENKRSNTSFMNGKILRVVKISLNRDDPVSFNITVADPKKHFPLLINVETELKFLNRLKFVYKENDEI